ncbi:GGDEF domain-containing protein [Azospirillum sp. SYSU D00513]|uniref:GGDEF domain-containing protein n=1 Tax=Azospirillum sp. SYSU D00513 TaxID=2812561 RepID=UPI001A95FA45|nr:GGDEF domain-containing protein [Azospirillum sp. SYSU D00513]
MTRKNRIFLSLCAALLATDIGLVAVGAATARDALMAAMHDRAATLREGFSIALYTTELKLMEIASFVAELEDVKTHLAAAGEALAADPGGDAASGEVERHRQALMDIVGPRWTQLRFRYLLRQLSFYLPPDGTVFLRAETPYAHGDRAEGPDSLVARVAASRRAATGFDIDRLSVGLRAAVPVAGDRPLGVVEVGTSLDTMMIPICPSSRCGTAILLDRAAVERRMDGYALGATFTDDRRTGDWLIEASTNPAITRVLMDPVQGAELATAEAALVRVGDRWLAATRFPLRDHLGKEDPGRAAVGSVLAWVDVDDAVHAFERSQLVNVGVAVLAFLLIAGLIHLLLGVITRRLEGEVAQRTAQVEALLAEVSHLAHRDPLTELFNRRAFTGRLREEIERCRADGTVFSLVSLDLDGFKRINDAHGHATGDEVLLAVATVIRETIGAKDAAGRLGGEEFSLLLPGTGLEGATALAERLRLRLSGRPVLTPSGDTLRVTFSAGVAEWIPALDEAALLRRADELLYAAKAAGRDRVMGREDRRVTIQLAD